MVYIHKAVCEFQACREDHGLSACIGVPEIEPEPVRLFPDALHVVLQNAKALSNPRSSWPPPANGKGTEARQGLCAGVGPQERANA